MGFELSPLLWAKIARNLSAGRVQSVALRLLVEKEKSIKEFKPEEFWDVSFVAKDNNNIQINFDLPRKKTDPLLSAEEAKSIQALIENTNLNISSISQRPVKTKPKPPFITSTLQQAASTRLGFNVKRTMRVAQKLYENGFTHKDYVYEEVLVDFKCDWSRIIENHLDILHLFWVHGDTIPDKDVNKNVLVSFNQKINVTPQYIESIYYYKNEPTKEFIRIKYIPPGRILIYKGDPSAARYLQVLDHIPLGNNNARVIVRHYRKFLKNKLLNNLILFKENQRKIFYKIFDEDYMILKTQTYNHDMGFISKDEIKLLGEDRIINYFWKWYKKSEDKDEPWKNINKTQNLDVYDKVILKYPPEIKKLEIANNIDIIRKTFVRFAAPLIFFMLII